MNESFTDDQQQRWTEWKAKGVAAEARLAARSVYISWAAGIALLGGAAMWLAR